MELGCTTSELTAGKRSKYKTIHYHNKNDSNIDNIDQCSDDDGDDTTTINTGDGCTLQHNTNIDNKQAQKVGCVNIRFKLRNSSYDDSIDDSDEGGSVVTTMTTSTLADTNTNNAGLKKLSTFRKSKSFNQKNSYPHNIRRIASGLRLAQSQAMAVAGFLPEYIEMQSTSDNKGKKNCIINTKLVTSNLSKSCDKDVGTINSNNNGNGQSNRSSFHGRGQTSFTYTITKIYLYLNVSPFQYF